VDASEAAVKSGQTCPASLSVMLKRGVQVFSREGLHAKVFVFGSAVAVTKERNIVVSARQFVRDNCHKSLGPEEIRKLRKIYREPVWRAGKTQQDNQRLRDSLRIVRLVDYDPPDGMTEASKKGERIARKRIKNTDTHTLYEFHWRYEHKFLERETILPINKDGDGRFFVCAPGTIVSISRWKRGLKAKTIVFLEVPRHRRIQLDELVKRVGRAAGNTLKNSRIVRDRNVIDLILDAFPPPLIK
jgi:hypothetical protein